MNRAVLLGNLYKSATMSNGVLRVTFDSQDITAGAASLEDASKIQSMALSKAYGTFIFIEGDLQDVPNDPPPAPAPEKDEKSASQRQRACLYRLWEAEGSEGDFEDYYKESMERNIQFLKTKIDKETKKKGL